MSVIWLSTLTRRIIIIIIIITVYYYNLYNCDDIDDNVAFYVVDLQKN